MVGPLPADWEARIRVLPSQTILHVKAEFRERAAAAMALGFEQTLAGSLLEYGRSKLLFAVPPKGVSLRTELGERFRLWGAGEFEVLLVRIEEQARAKAAARRRARGRPCPGMRARQLVREGAYSKGVAALTTSVAELAPAEQQDWARRLLPGQLGPSHGAC